MLKNVLRLPEIVVSDRSGNIFEIPGLSMAGMSVNRPVLPESGDLIPLPEGSDLFTLPGRATIGYDRAAEAFVEVSTYSGEDVFPVAAFMAPAHLQLYRSAFRRLSGAPRLSLYSYTAVGWKEGSFYAAGIRIDQDQRQDSKFVDRETIHRKALILKEQKSNNRLVQHLVDNCVFRYGCPAARNFVMGRWECPLPISPSCNSVCIGCISQQPSHTLVKASQDRIEFVPTVEEILDIALPHLEVASRPVVSFGQGCEGEPLLMGEVIEESIRQIRKKTQRGIININTNGSLPEVVERLCSVGLDSIRVSMNSAQEHLYYAYFHPRGYGFDHVKETLMIVRRFGRWSSLNYFSFPGLTDHRTELGALEKLIREVRLNMIQTRNLNIDPDWYIEALTLNDLEQDSLGMRNWIEHIRKSFPWIKLGYFNPPREEMKEKHFRFPR